MRNYKLVVDENVGLRDPDKFAGRYGLTMRVRHIDRHLKPYAAHFEDCEVKNGAILSSFSGHGDTPEEAISDYLEQIAGKRMVKGAYGDHRTEFICPNVWEHQAVTK